MLVLQNLIKPGSRVKKGDVVAEFDRQNMLNRLDDFRATVAQNQASLKKQKAELELSRKVHEQTIATAKADLDKAKLDIQTTPVLGAIDAERLKLALDEADSRYKQLLNEVKYVDIGEKAQIRASEIELQQAQIELRRVEANADRMLARAAIDGLTVMQSMIRGSEFSQIQQGDQLFPGQFYMQIVDPASMVVNATVNQADVEQIRIGAKAKVRFDAYPDLELPAHIDAIGAITRTGGFRASYYKEIPVRLKLDKMDPRVIPDLSVSADVIVQREEQAAIAPLESVFRDGPGTRPFVLVRRPGQTELERREVELGLASNLHVAVRSGLKAGEMVALERPPKVVETRR